MTAQKMTTQLEEDVRTRLRTERWKGFSHHEHDLILSLLLGLQAQERVGDDVSLCDGRAQAQARQQGAEVSECEYSNG